MRYLGLSGTLVSLAVTRLSWLRLGRLALVERLNPTRAATRNDKSSYANIWNKDSPCPYVARNEPQCAQFTGEAYARLFVEDQSDASKNERKDVQASGININTLLADLEPANGDVFIMRLKPAETCDWAPPVGKQGCP